jgi:hypothetical protein
VVWEAGGAIPPPTRFGTPISQQLSGRKYVLELFLFLRAQLYTKRVSLPRGINPRDTAFVRAGENLNGISDLERSSILHLSTVEKRSDDEPTGKHRKKEPKEKSKQNEPCEPNKVPPSG